MKKIIIEQDGIEKDSDIINKLFDLREEEIETTEREDREQYIKDNNLRDVTHDILIEEINNVESLDDIVRCKILKMLDKLLDNRERMQSYDCRKYYKEGIKDVINFILECN